MVEFDPKQIEFGGPARYRIVLRGRMDSAWNDRLSGMTVSVNEVDGEEPSTVLMGKIRDQAQLKGVLDTVFSLNLPILEVETV